MNGLPLPKSSADFPDNPEYERPKSEKDVVIALPYCLYKESFSPLIKDRFTEMSAIIEEHYKQIDKRCVRIFELGEPFNVGNLSKEELSETGTPCVIYGELFTTYGATINKVVSHTNKSKGMTFKPKRRFIVSIFNYS